MALQNVKDTFYDILTSFSRGKKQGFLASAILTSDNIDSPISGSPWCDKSNTRLTCILINESEISHKTKQI